MPDGVCRGSIVFADGVIRAIDDGASVAAGAIDCDGDLVKPGLIELHTDNLERHIQPRPGVDWPHAPAIIAHDAELAGVGITTVFDALRVGSLISTGRGYGEYARGMADEILAARNAGVLRVNHLIHLRAEVCSETLTSELAKFGPEDCVGIVSLMDHTPGQRQFADLAQLRRYMRGKYGLTEEEFQAHVEVQTALGNRVRASHEQATVEAARAWGDPARGISTVTSAPAQATGLDDRGRLEIGKRADVVRVHRFGKGGAVRGTWVSGNRVA
ncbi:MAG: alpha-D-ribose 1-methylphosphonate 5-triphosphate diphosphatase [Paracoccaceae bacterium]